MTTLAMTVTVNAIESDVTPLPGRYRGADGAAAIGMAGVVDAWLTGTRRTAAA